MPFHPDTHNAAIIWERRNDMIGAIPATVVSLLSQALHMGFAPHTAVIETECHPLHAQLLLSCRSRLTT